MIVRILFAKIRAFKVNFPFTEVPNIVRILFACYNYDSHFGQSKSNDSDFEQAVFGDSDNAEDKTSEHIAK